MRDEFEIIEEVDIAAPVELVYDFFTKPELLTQWMGTAAELDPRPGGVFCVTIEEHDDSGPNTPANATSANTTRGNFVELIPHERLVFTWGFAVAASTTVTVTFTPVGSHGEHTRVQLHHSGFVEDKNRDVHRQGWLHYLHRIRLAANGQNPGIDPGPRNSPYALGLGTWSCPQPSTFHT